MLFQVILTIILFFTINYSTYKLCDEIGLPKWLDYLPWICRKCLNFWTQTFIYVTIFILSSYTYWYLLLMGNILNILNTIAIYIDEKKNI